MKAFHRNRGEQRKSGMHSVRSARWRNRGFRRALTFVVFGGLLAAVAPVTNAAADQAPAYGDYRPGAGVDGDVPKPLDLKDVPATAKLAEPLASKGRGFTTAELNVQSLGSRLQFSSKAPAPKAQKSTNATGADRSNGPADDFNHYYCAYYPNSVSATPPPPASGSQYAMAKAYDTLWGYAQAFDAQDGLFQSPHTSSANIAMDLNITVPIDWPQPSQMNAYVNPFFQGGHYVETTISPFTFSSSQASTRQLIQFGWSRDATPFMQTLWDIQTSKGDGTSELIHYYWHGLEDGNYYVFNVDSTPAHTYKFSARTTTSATSNPVFGAAATAQIDYGSGQLDAPSLGPLNLFRASMDEYYVIEYLLPMDWELTNC
ncbi:hypothetical protein EV382_3518 [Micromonospora violae]|uniref:Uncharacterized protein n=1 Tax=Micromonospora violae TaxID=1278207 RepID=A0A4Q7UG09_9ACTN|nr:hypothetical protein [Micromonospora violae]RZT80272.1 hypothetical protein EV382_3518 [Micromonospora violae]